MLGRCSHEFSWPRRSPQGDYYQVCLLCAIEYKYDWTTMRRIERVEQVAPEPSLTLYRSKAQPVRPTWVPRARRLKLKTAARYRSKNLGIWSEGRLENLSQSGVLLRGPQSFPNNTVIEMVFEMPEEISGQANSEVLCQGRVVRSKSLPEAPGSTEMAASILDYKFLHPH